MARFRWQGRLATIAGMITVVAGAALTGAAREGRSREMPAAEDSTLRYECPLDAFYLTKQQGGSPAGTEIVAASGPITNIPEFHDCQRFIVHDRKLSRLMQRRERYDSLFAIFASSALVVQPDSFPNVRAGQSRTAATIYSWGGRYAPLGIMPRFNCLLLSGPTTPAGKWRARIVPVDMKDEDCLKVMAIDTSIGTELAVNRTVFDGLHSADYPTVARWERDPKRNEYFIGIRCGAGWCSVHSAGLALGSPPVSPLVSPTPPISGAMNAGQRRVRLVKGWHDEQRLATVSAGHAVPSSLSAFVIPHPELGAYDTAAFQAGWREVASMVVPGSLPYEKLGLGPGSNRLELVWAKDKQWYARVTSGTGTPRYFRVWRHDHTGLGFPIPATARWRWLANDETVWTRCIEGCCQVLQPEVPASAVPSGIVGT